MDISIPNIDLIQTLGYAPCNFTCNLPVPEAESQEYAAHRFTVNGQYVVYRAAKITPTKPGLFVTIWKRNEHGITVPFDATDNIDLLVISTQKDGQFGHFVIPKLILLEKGIMHSSAQAGKRGMRVYPPWEKGLNKQATKTQLWQAAYFVAMDDTERMKKLYS